MTRHVALIRGINVGKAKRIAMADLRALVEGLGARGVRTLLNSGNVVFDGGAGGAARIAARIETGLAAELGVPARVTVLTAAEFEAIAAKNPLGRIAHDPARMLVAFFLDAKAMAGLPALSRQDWKPEAMELAARAAYLWCAGGILESPLLKAVTRAVDEGLTTRNWATVEKIRALL